MADSEPKTESREARFRSAILIYFPMFIATLSLVTSIYNGWLNGKFVDFIQRNSSRLEYMHTCKEIIDAYFQVQLKIGAVGAAGERVTPAIRAEAVNAVARIGALGTYMANLRDEAARVRYTNLTQSLDTLAREASRLPPDELKRRFEAPDREFDQMNSECIKSAKSF